MKQFDEFSEIKKEREKARAFVVGVLERNLAFVCAFDRMIADSQKAKSEIKKAIKIVKN